MTTHHERQRLHVAYVGNFGPPHSTENHVAETLRRMGHHVVQLQENDRATWTWLEWADGLTEMDLVLWTRTGSLTPPDEIVQPMLERCVRLGVPTVGFHLDRWWGLAREGQVHESPFFRCAIVATADGGHDLEWAAAGVNHLWLPPAVAEFECGYGWPRAEFASRVAFVGSHTSYHAEWPWRQRMVRLLSHRYGAREFRAWPEPGAEAIRGEALRDLYASVEVVAGDSCLAGGATRYWSDRVPETLGRGGLLVHPRVAGIEDQFVDGEHLVLVPPEDPEALFAALDEVLGWPAWRRSDMRHAALVHVLQHHTYRQRMATLLGAALGAS